MVCRLTLTSFAAGGTRVMAVPSGLLLPPHAHFVRGGGDGVRRMLTTLRTLRLTLTSFAAGGTCIQMRQRLNVSLPPHAHFVRGGDFMELAIVRVALPPHAHFVRGGGDQPLYPHLPSGCCPPHAHFVRGGGDWHILSPDDKHWIPPHAHFVRGGGDTNSCASERPPSSRLTLTSFAAGGTP